VGIWVLDKNVCPAVMIECGYLTDEKDRAFISSNKNRQLIAQKILRAIEQYATAKDPEVNSIINTTSLDTVPKATVKTTENPLVYIDGKEKGRLKQLGGLDKLMEPGNIKSMMVYKGSEAIENYGSKGSEGVIVIISNNGTEPSPKPAPSPKVTKPTVIRTTDGQNPMIYIDGKESGRVNDGKMKALKGEDIESLNVLKGESAVHLYGEKGRDGVIEIKMKKDKSGEMNYTPRETPDVVFAKVEIAPEFPGGQQAWSRYLQRTLNANIPVEKGAPAGTYGVVIRFLVNKDGSIQDFEPLTKNGYGTEEEAIRILKQGPKWTPAIQNGRKVAAFVEQKLTFVVAEQ
jgi:protein TonB